MKTLEQVKEHLLHNYYDCSDKICGFLVGCELKDPKEVIKFLKEDDYVYDFDDFLGWFDGKYDEEDCDCHCCKSAKGDIPELHKHFYNTVESLFHDVLLGKDIVFQVKEEPKKKPFKYQGEERDTLIEEYKNKTDILFFMHNNPTVLDEKGNEYKDYLKKRLDDIQSDLNKKVDE